MLVHFTNLTPVYIIISTWVFSWFHHLLKSLTKSSYSLDMLQISPLFWIDNYLTCNVHNDISWCDCFILTWSSSIYLFLMVIDYTHICLFWNHSSCPLLNILSLTYQSQSWSHCIIPHEFCLLLLILSSALHSYLYSISLTNNMIFLILVLSFRNELTH